MKSQTNITLHGNMMSLYQQGVLIIGSPGIGKSQLALELLDRGHTLIADDVALISRQEKKLIAECPELTQQFLYVHGIGLISVTDVFGKKAFAKKTILQFIIQLIDKLSMDINLETDQKVKNILDTEVPIFNLPLSKFTHLALMTELLVKNFILNHAGKKASHLFLNKHQKLIRERSLLPC